MGIRTIPNAAGSEANGEILPPKDNKIIIMPLIFYFSNSKWPVVGLPGLEDSSER